jgi:hypothetical protein
MSTKAAPMGPHHSSLPRGHVEELEVPELGRQDIKNYLLQLAGDSDSPLGDFASVQEALENITQNCDFANPDVTDLGTLTKQWTAIARQIGWSSSDDLPCSHTRNAARSSASMQRSARLV